MIAGGAQRRDDREPVHARQHAVDDHRIEPFAGGQKQTLPSVFGVVDGMAAFLEALDEERGGFAIVLDDQEFHLSYFVRAPVPGRHGAVRDLCNAGRISRSSLPASTR